MQRSSRALLDRRAVEKASSGRKWNRVYQVSLSLVFVLWGLVLLLSLWISRGDGYRDGSAGLAGGISTWHEPKIEHNKHSGILDKHPSQEIGSNHSKKGSCPSVAKTKKPRYQFHAAEGDTNSVSAVMQPEAVGLDEFKSRAFSSKSKSGTGHYGGVKRRLELGGTEYNYASASKGAKVLAYNKEAKGAANILSTDKDKYLRNPCSAEEKFVVIELSEETDFLLKSRNGYLKLNLLSHYGSEFYCTLSVIEVYGVDAIEQTLENLISVQDDVFVPDEGTAPRKPPSSPLESLQSDDLYRNLYKELEYDSSGENLDVKHEIKKNTVPDPVEEIRHQVGRLPADTVLKILMQKVRSLDLNLSVLEPYLEELNLRYSDIFKEFDEDLGGKDKLLEKIRSDIRNLFESQEAIAKHIDDLSSWKYLVSMQLETLLRDNVEIRFLSCLYDIFPECP
ncbi:hypothetical protein Pint_18383 [Pistacia integerrima]|uniref:Uncharacterized protein n=1 Tax=Pistacia integerrima TaxID=434235 RepID=A0ACC0YXG5_9ROSI|nr:hypothetical protein Pint_18383 [Pistacia integerrima]